MKNMNQETEANEPLEETGSKQREEYIQAIIDKLKAVNYIQPGELPNIDLYMDQVTTFMDEHLESSKRYSDDKLLTKTMINNYTKNNLLPSPDKKKYSQDHMYLLLFIYYLKNILSINDTKSIVSPLTDMFYKNGSISLEEIYAEIFKIEYDQMHSITKDVIRKFAKSKETFQNVKDQKEQDFLRILSFISMLCFDVYMKKQMIAKIIDDNFLTSRDKK